MKIPPQPGHLCNLGVQRLERLARVAFPAALRAQTVSEIFRRRLQIRDGGGLDAGQRVRGQRFADGIGGGDGAEIVFGLWFYKDAAPTALGTAAICRCGKGLPTERERSKNWLENLMKFALPIKFFQAGCVAAAIGFGLPRSYGTWRNKRKEGSL